MYGTRIMKQCDRTKQPNDLLPGLRFLPGLGMVLQVAEQIAELGRFEILEQILRHERNGRLVHRFNLISRDGPPLVSANFVIPYPPGFPIMVPGQVITADTIEFMRKLDVKEIHGYNAMQGLKLVNSAALQKLDGTKSHSTSANPVKQKKG